MPKKKNEIDMKKYKRILIDKRKRIFGDVQQLEEEVLNKSLKEASGDITGYSTHSADSATDSADREVILSLASTEQKLLRDIEHALERIAKGTYGVCELCNTQISDARLEAKPESALCIDCKKKYNL